MTSGKEPPANPLVSPPGIPPASLRKPFANKGIMEAWTFAELDEWNRFKHQDPAAAEALLDKKTEEALARNAVCKTAESKPPRECSEEEIIEIVCLGVDLGGGDDYAKQVLIHGQFDEHPDAHFVFHRPLRRYPQQEADRLVADLRRGYEVDSLRTYRDTDGKPLHWVIKAKHADSGKTITLPMRQKNGIYELEEPTYLHRTPLYGLHELELIYDILPLDELGIIAGDEWNAEALIDLGLPATTSGNGPIEQADWDKIYRANIISGPTMIKPALSTGMK